MEEDIKILEEWIKRHKKLDYYLVEIKIIENLIKGYREERYLRIHYENRLDNMEQLYIDKDKIKEKIEELKKRKKDLLQLPSDCGRSIALEDCDDKIELYKELMEDK